MSTYSREPIVPRTKPSKAESDFTMPSDRTMHRRGFKKRYLNGALMWIKGTADEADAELELRRVKAAEISAGLNIKECGDAHYRKSRSNAWVLGVSV